LIQAVKFLISIPAGFYYPGENSSMN